MPWAYIYRLLGPGLHWFKPQSLFLRAIAEARAAGRPEAAEHIELLLDLRNRVMCEQRKPDCEVGLSGNRPRGERKTQL